jgi:membrane-associated phospholipid phosphatase
MTAAGSLRLWAPKVWVIPALALTGALALLLGGGNERLFLMVNALGPASSDPLWAGLTILGDTVVALALCVVLARRRPDLLWAVVPAALLATLWVHAYKPVFDVLRPPAVLVKDSFHVIGPAYHYHSFPSGHATTAFALAGLCVLGFRMGPWSILPVAVALLVAASRIIVGVHWPIDVLAGACGGWLAAAVGLKIASLLPFGTSAPAQWILAVAFGGCAVALLAGYDTGYAQALWFQRAIGLVCLAALAATFAAGQRRRGAAAG